MCNDPQDDTVCVGIRDVAGVNFQEICATAVEMVVALVSAPRRLSFASPRSLDEWDGSRSLVEAEHAHLPNSGGWRQDTSNDGRRGTSESQFGQAPALN
jgi:hypothetical protein